MLRSCLLGLAFALFAGLFTQTASAQYYGRPGYGPGPGYEYGPGPDYRRGHGRGQFCANENEICDVGGVANVRYGAHGQYVVRRVHGSIPCANQYFGDPAPGIVKHCVID
ncbi:hypothetical protein GCM10022626_24840 [[Pseudomonas] carboxydohydrogena]